MKQRGFTLLELLVVIAIIGILATIVLVSTSKSRDQGKYSQILQQMKQVNNALSLYVFDKYASVWPDTVNTGNQHLDYYITGVFPGGTTMATKNLFVGLKSYLGGIPPTVGSLGFYAYNVSVSPVSLTCPDPNPGSGVNIRIGDDGVGGSSAKSIPPLFYYLDKIVDNDDGKDCGKVRMRYPSPDPEIYWILARDKNDFGF